MTRLEPVAILGVIPARGGSQGVPLKNIRPLGGLPLIVHTIRAALGCSLITDVVVSTDHDRIRQIAVEHGAQAPFVRPAELAGHLALAIPTVQHAVREMEARRNGPYDYIVMLQPTTPLRTASDLTEALSRLVATPEADGIISIVDVDNWHPMKMKRFAGPRLVDYEKPPTENPPRQTLPPVFMVNGALYATRRQALMEQNSFQGQYCLGHLMPSERSVNIDNELDFLMAEALLARRDAGPQPTPAVAGDSKPASP